MDHAQIAIGLLYNGTANTWVYLDGSAATFMPWAKGYPRARYPDEATDPSNGYMILAGDGSSLWKNDLAFATTG
ncbi:hypothetical protein AAVH_43190, partial [Aphelenchoides avenae]